MAYIPRLARQIVSNRLSGKVSDRPRSKLLCKSKPGDMPRAEPWACRGEAAKQFQSAAHLHQVQTGRHLRAGYAAFAIGQADAESPGRLPPALRCKFFRLRQRQDAKRFGRGDCGGKALRLSIRLTSSTKLRRAAAAPGSAESGRDSLAGSCGADCGAAGSFPATGAQNKMDENCPHFSGRGERSDTVPVTIQKSNNPHQRR